MQVSEAKTKIKDGDLLSFQGIWKLSHQIRWFTKSKYSHVGLALWIETSAGRRLCVIESTHGGVRVVPFDYLVNNYLGRGAAMSWHPLRGDVDGNIIVINALSLWGRGFPHPLQMLLIAFNWVRQWFIWKKKDYDLNRRKMTCSAMVTQALVMSGLPWTKEPDITTPVEVTKFSWYPQEIELTLDNCPNAL